MGHDIFGFKTKRSRTQIAYLRRGAWNSLGRKIYEALKAEKFDAGCSGCGEKETFTKVQLLEALDYLRDDDELEPERDFISDCLANLNKDDRIVILFG